MEKKEETMKKRCITALLCLLLGGAILCTSAFALAGDIDGDGKLGNSDLSMLISFLSGHGESVKIANLDADNNGKVNNRDAVIIAQALAGWDVELFGGIGADGADIDVSELR